MTSGGGSSDSQAPPPRKRARLVVATPSTQSVHTESIEDFSLSMDVDQTDTLIKSGVSLSDGLMIRTMRTMRTMRGQLLPPVRCKRLSGGMWEMANTFTTSSLRGIRNQSGIPRGTLTERMASFLVLLSSIMRDMGGGRAIVNQSPQRGTPEVYTIDLLYLHDLHLEDISIVPSTHCLRS